MSDAARLHRAARLLRLVTLAAALLLATLAALAAWLLLSGRRAEFSAIRIEDQGMAPLPTALSILLVGALIVLALLRLARMLAKVGAGSPFGAARDLRGFATFLFLSVLASIVAPSALQLALAGHGPQRLDLSLSMSDAVMLLITGLLFFVARLLDEAQRVADDASQIV
jgi:hypothetical protein